MAMQEEGLTLNVVFGPTQIALQLQGLVSRTEQ